MTEERWQELVGRIQDDFTLETQEEEQDPETRSTIHIVIFKGPVGRIKLERTVSPKVLDERALGGSKFGVGTRIQRKYSTTDSVDRLEAYRWDEAKEFWAPFDPAALL